MHVSSIGKKIFIGVGDIHPDIQILDGPKDGSTAGNPDGRTDGAKIITPHKKMFLFSKLYLINKILKHIEK